MTVAEFLPYSRGASIGGAPGRRYAQRAQAVLGSGVPCHAGSYMSTDKILDLDGDMKETYPGGIYELDR
jgi:hypothetical protein